MTAAVLAALLPRGQVLDTHVSLELLVIDTWDGERRAPWCLVSCRDMARSLANVHIFPQASCSLCHWRMPHGVYGAKACIQSFLKPGSIGFVSACWVIVSIWQAAAHVIVPVLILATVDHFSATTELYCYDRCFHFVSQRFIRISLWTHSLAGVLCHMGCLQLGTPLPRWLPVLHRRMPCLG